MKRVEDRGGTQIATKVEGGTSVFPVGSGRMIPDLGGTSMPPTQGVTVTGIMPRHTQDPVSFTGPGNFNSRILTHNLAVYREGATLTPAPHHGPAPPAHAAQPSSVIHQMSAAAVKTETISLSPAAVSLQYSRSNTGNSITVAAVSSPSLHNLTLPQIVPQKGGGGGPVPPPIFTGGTTVRTVTPAQNIPSSGGNPSFQRLRYSWIPPLERPGTLHKTGLKVEDALSYLDQVKFKFGSQPQVYNDFLDIMKEFKSQSIDTPGVISRVSTLFRGHPELIVGFNTFLPPGYKIEVQTSEGQHNIPGHPHTLQVQTIVHTPHGIHMMGSQGMMGPAITSTASMQYNSPSTQFNSTTTQYNSTTVQAAPPILSAPSSLLPVQRTPNHTPKYQVKSEPLPTLAVTLPSAATVVPAVQPPPSLSRTNIQDNNSAVLAQAAAAAVYATVPSVGGGGGGGGTPSVAPVIAAANLASSMPSIASLLPLQPPLGPPQTSVANATAVVPNAVTIGSLATASPLPANNAQPPQPVSTPTPPNQQTPNSVSANQQPVEFNHAINYVNKIKNRFQGQPDVYKQFLEILHTYQKDQRAIKEGGTHKSSLTESEVYAQVSRLFQQQEDLLAEFSQFLPEATNDSSSDAIQLSSKTMAAANNESLIAATTISNNKRSATPKSNNIVTPAVGKPLPLSSDRSSTPGAVSGAPPTPPVITSGAGDNNLKRPVQPNSGGNRMQPPVKKPRLGVLKDVSLAEAGKFGTLNEYAFFDKVRKALNSAEVYENFLRCLVLFNQEVVSRQELVQLVNPFLNKNPELLKWFKDFVGFKDGARESGLPTIPPPTADVSAPMPPLHPPRHERIPGDTAMEIDYASCKRLGASYCALPKNFVQPKCTGRGTGNTICREVLNDTWVSFPSWSEDSQFVSSRKTQYEENIYRTEDERFEFDVVLETNRDTIKVLECQQKKMSRMPPEEAARYRLDDSLGGTSATIHQRAVRRIYGDKAADIIDGLKRNPVVAVPLVLRRLKAKDGEWREVQKQYNKIWREQNEKYYLKSLDHQGIIFKQNDVRFIRSKSLLNEVETLYDEAHEAEEQSGQPSAGPHLTLTYKDKAMLEDASQLLIHHVKRQTGVHKQDKHKIKTFLRQHLPDIFYQTRLDMSEEEDEDSQEETEEPDSQDQDQDKEQDKDRTKVKELTVKEEEIQEELKESKIPPHTKGLSPTDEYTMLMGNNNIYLFMRLHSILTERLGKIYDQALIIAAEDGVNNDKKESTAAALRLKPKNGLSSTDYYPAFLDLVRNLLDGNMENQAYEDTLREMFGIHAFTAFTLDKVIGNAVRQLQQIATDETCQDCLELYLNEKKSGGAGGTVDTAEDRYYNELMYQKKSEKLLTEENCFKIIFYRDNGRVTIELLDTDSAETREGSEGDADADDEPSNQDGALDNLIGPHISEDAQAHLLVKPVFLMRSVRQYRRKNRHKLVPRPAKPQESAEPDSKESTPKDEETEASKDKATTSKGALAMASRLGLDDESILMSEKSACSLTEDTLRVVWVVNSENYIYKKNSLSRSRKSHPDVCKRKFQKFNTWHSEWAKSKVTTKDTSYTNDWLMGKVEGLAPNQTTRVTVNDTMNTPYRTFTKFKAEMLKGPKTN